MKIRNLILIGSLISIALVFVFSLTVYVNFNKVAEENERELIANRIHETISELDLVMYEYLTYRGDRMIQQWNSKHNEAIKLFEEQDGELEAIKENYDFVKDLFSQIVANHEIGRTIELEERLVAQLLIKSHEIISESTWISEDAYGNAIDAQKKANTSMAISLIVLFIALIGISFYTIRRITKPLNKLSVGTEIIGRGNLKHRIDIKSRDEIGELADSFNKMTKSLRAITTSRDELNKEVIERKRAENKLRKSYKKLRELDKLKDNFLGSTTHELKTPLIPIKAQLQLLLSNDYGKLNKEQREALEMILRNEEQLNRLINNILDITKVRSKRLSLILERVPLEKIIIDGVRNMSQATKIKNIKLSLKPIPELPKIFIDERRIVQVVGNLLGNAIKFTPEKGRIEVEMKKVNDSIEVSVQDSGIGMNKKILKKLFTPFFQGKSGITRKYGGTGLGLSISEGIIEAHGGKIWAKSPGEGKGSTFSFSLPIKNKSL